MKRKIFITIWLLNIILLAGCKKESNDAIINNTTVNNPAVIKVSPPQLNPYSITYMLTVGTQDPGALINWNSGYVTSASLSFDGVQTAVNQSPVYTATDNVQKADLFGRAVLGKVAAITGRYKDINYTISLNQSNNTFALYLSGVCTVNNAIMPVQLIVTEPLGLEAHWVCCTGLSTYDMSIAPGQNYNALFTINMVNLISGITSNMLNAATIENGTIVIAQNSNQGLYQLVRNNLNLNIACALTNINQSAATGIASNN